MFEIGDTVRVVGSGEMRTIVGIGPRCILHDSDRE